MDWVSLLNCIVANHSKVEVRCLQSSMRETKYSFDKTGITILQSFVTFLTLTRHHLIFVTQGHKAWYSYLLAIFVSFQRVTDICRLTHIQQTLACIESIWFHWSCVVVNHSEASNGGAWSQFEVEVS